MTLLNRARASVIPVTSILRLPREPRGTSAGTHVLSGTSASTHVLTSGRPQVTLAGLKEALCTHTAPGHPQTQH